MKKVIAVFLILCLCAGLCACASMDKYEETLGDDYKKTKLDDDDLEVYAALMDIDEDDYDIESALEAIHKDNGTSVVIIECESKAKAEKLAEDAEGIVEYLEHLYGSEYSFEIATQGRFAMFGESSAVNDAIGASELGSWVYVVAAIVILAIVFGCAGAFANLASEKGYSFGVYFVLCFFFTVIGYAWVAALPDREAKEEIKRLRHTVEDLSYRLTGSGGIPNRNKYQTGGVAPGSYAPAEQEEKWTCENCGMPNSMNYGQCKRCGACKGSKEVMIM